MEIANDNLLGISSPPVPDPIKPPQTEDRSLDEVYSGMRQEVFQKTNPMLPRPEDSIFQSQWAEAKAYTQEKDYVTTMLSDPDNLGGVAPNIVSAAQTHFDGQNLKDTAVSIRATALLLNRSVEDIDPAQLPVYMKGVAAQLGKPEPKTIGAYRNMLGNHFIGAKKREAAFTDLTQRLVSDQLFSAQSQEQAPASKDVARTLAAWFEANPEMASDPSKHWMLARSANEFSQRMLKELDPVKGPAAQTFQTLVNFTQGKTDPDQLSDLAKTLSAMNPEERNKVYQFTAIAAQANQIDRKALSQFAVNLGQSFSRGFDFVPQTVLRDKEGGVSGWINAIESGVQVWVPTDGDLSQASVGNAPESAMRGVMEEGQYRLASPEERKTLLKSGGNAMEAFQIERELKSIAKSSVDPIRELSNGGLLGAMERGAYGLSGSLPLMGAVAINPFLGVAAYQAMEYDRIRMENPDLPLAAANSLALIEGAGNAAIDKLQLMGLAGRSPMLAKTMQGMKTGGILNYLKRVGLVQLEQFTQENIQDLIAPVVEGIAASIREDMPGTDFGEDVKEYFNTRPEVFFAVLPLALIGGGFASADAIKNPAATFTRDAMRAAGFSDQSIEFVFSSADPAQMQQRMQEEWKKRTPEDIQRGIQIAEEQSKSQQANTVPYQLAIDEQPNGESIFVVTDPTDGTEVLRTPDIDAAMEVIAQKQVAEIQSERQSITDLVDWANKNILRGAKFTLDAAPKMVKDAVALFEKLGDQRALRVLRERLTVAGINPDGDLTGVGIFGETTVEQVRDAVYRAVITLQENSNPIDAFEEIGHGFDKVALAEGKVRIEQFVKWLEQTEAATGITLNRANATEVLESMAVVRQDWISGKLDDSSLPVSFVAYLKKLATVLADAIARFVKIQSAMSEGKIDKTFAEYLDESVGISPQEKFDRIAEEEAAILNPSFAVREEETDPAADDPGTEAGTPAPDVEVNELNPDEQNGSEWQDIPWREDLLYSVKVLPTAFPNMNKALFDEIMAASPDGKIRSIYIDRMKAGGEYLGIDLQGGMFFPTILENLQNGVAWAFNSVSVATTVYNKAMKQGGYLVLAIMQEGNIIGNKTFTYIWFENLKRNIRAKKVTKEAALKELNRVRERWITKQVFSEPPTKIPVLDDKGNPKIDAKGKPVYETKVAVLDEDGNPKTNAKGKPIYLKETVELTGHTTEWKSLAEAEAAFLDLPQIVRGNTYFNKGFDKKRGIATYGKLLTIENSKAGFPDAKQLVADLEEPSLKGLPAQSIVAVIQIDKVPKGQNPVLTASEAGVPEHLSYGFVLKGKPIAKMTKFKTLASLNPKIKDWQMSQDKERWEIQQAVSYAVRETKQSAKEIKSMVDAMSAQEIRDRLDEAKLTSTPRMVAMLGEFPQYLQPIIEYMMDRRKQLLDGKVSPRDVAKAYWMTLASIGADAIDVSTIAAQAEKNGIAFNPDPMFMTVGKRGQMQMRPEELAAYWLGTPEGQQALDNVENGTFNESEWESGLILRDAYGRNDLREKWRVTGTGQENTNQTITVGGESVEVKVNEKGNWSTTIEEENVSVELPEGMTEANRIQNSGAVGLPKEDKANLTNLLELTARINDAKGDPQQLEEAVMSAVGIGEGKKGFISHFLGFGGWSTIDAVELNIWLTGLGDTTRAPEKQKIIAAIAKKASGQSATRADIFTRIRKAILSLRNKASGGKKIPVDVAPHIIHHWIWDAAKDIQTTHEGLYYAMTNYSVRKVDPLLEKYDGMNSVETTKEGRRFSPIVRDLLQRRKDGEEVPREVIDEAINAYFPAQLVPVPSSLTELPTSKQIEDAIDAGQLRMQEQSPLPEAGESVTLRQDVPSWTKRQVGVVTIKGVNGTRYEAAAMIESPEFLLAEAASLKIALGGNKQPHIRIKGKWSKNQNMPPNLEEWTQVGYNPDRHSFYYDRGTMQQVVGGSRAYQIGNTVFVENAVFGDGQISDLTYSIRKVEDSGIEAKIDKLNRGPEERLTLYSRVKDRFLEVVKRNAEIVEQAIADGATPEATRRLQLQQGIIELEGIFRALPREVRSRIGGFTRLSSIAPMDVYKDGTKVSEGKNRAGAIISAWMREGDNIGAAIKRTELPQGYSMQENFDTARTDQALAAFFKDRVEKIDRQLERVLRKEYDLQLEKIWKRSKPKKSKPGERPKGIGAEIQRLFADLKVISELDEDQARSAITAMQDLIDTSDLPVEEEAYQKQLMGLANLVGNWKGADASRRASAVNQLRDTWTAGYANFKVALIRDAARIRDMQDMATLATGEWGDNFFKRDRNKRKAATGWGRFNNLLYNIVSWDGVMHLVFGDKSPLADNFSDMQRKADNAKEDGVQEAMQDIEDLFTLVAGSRAAGEQLQYNMTQLSVTTAQGQLSQMQAVTASLMWMQEDGRRHMIGNLDDDGKPTMEGWHYDQDWVTSVEKQLTPESLMLRQFLLEKYEQGWFPLNEVYKTINGVNLPQITNYSPMSLTPLKSPGNVTIDAISGQPLGGGVNFGGLMNRGTSVAEPDFKDALQVYIAHTKTTEHFKAYAPFMQDAGRVLKNRKVQNAISEAFGPEAPKVLNTWLTMLAQGGNRDASLGLEFSQLGSDALSRATQMALIGRVGTLFVQTTQLAAASAEMPTGSYLVRLSKLLTGNLGWGAALKSQYIQRRITALPPVVQEAMRGLAGDKPNKLKRAVRNLGNLISGADGLFTAGTFAIVYDYQLNQAETVLGMSRKMAEDYAAEIAERITDRLAQPIRMGAKSIVEVTNTNSAFRVVFAFASEPRKNLALMTYALAKRPMATKLRTLGYLLVGNALFSSIIRTAWRDARDEDDDEWFDERNWNIKKMLLTSLTDPFMGIPLFGEAIQEAAYTLTGTYYNNSDLLSVSRAMRAIRNVGDTFAGDRDMDEILGDVNALLGLGGLFNQNIAAIASLSTVAKDVFGVGNNTVKMATDPE